MIMNALTIDVEDYFQVHAFSDVIRPEDWDSFEPRIEKNTYRILDLLDSFNGPPTTDHRPGTKPSATFFILGWNAERYPALVKEIHERGHEVACHGYAHQRILNQTQEEFREDVKKAKAILEDLTGEKIIGYRAPTYSITEKTLWALKILSEEGFKYDSSIFPVSHDYYGFPQAPRFPFIIEKPEDSNIMEQILNPRYVHLRRANKTNRPDQSPTTKRLPTEASDFSKSKSPTGNLQQATCNLQPESGASSNLIEFPLSTVRFGGLNIPCAGGGYFRLFPYMLTRKLLDSLNNAGKPFIFYLHPWELNKNLPEVKSANFLEQFRTRINLQKTEEKLKKLFQDFEFSSLLEILDL